MKDWTQKIKDNAHLIAADYECMEAVLADDTESRYTHECAKTVFAERFMELMEGEQKKDIKDTEFYKMCKMCGDSITATLTTNKGRTISFKGSKIDETLEQMKGEPNDNT